MFLFLFLYLYFDFHILRWYDVGFIFLYFL